MDTLPDIISCIRERAVCRLIYILKCQSMTFSTYWTNRGFPWEHDPGPPKNMSWARLFSETPNYRAISETYMNADKFRWHFGPMYYRGRLKTGEVKVLVIGQEGAMDESLAHRAFVGFSGGIMQYLLDYIGIDFQYLFLNTFVYPIHGQYTERKIKILGQNLDSPMVKQRHKILDYVRSKNDISLVIGVGNAAKETIKTWIESHGGNCPDGIADLTTADSHVLHPRTKAIGIIHPGAMQQPSNIPTVLANYQQVLAQIGVWINQDATWLPPDEGMTRDFTIPVEIKTKSIPFRDLPAGISWRIGHGNSTSKRMDNQRSIQIYAEVPSGQGHSPKYRGLSKGYKSGYAENVNDVPYEPPVDEHEDYDKGPTKSFLKLVYGGYPGLQWPDFTNLGITSHASLGILPLFRGRPGKSTMLIIADQQSVDDLFCMRALCGDSGQRLQAWLEAGGINESYCIIRSMPVDMTGLPLYKRKALAANPQIKKIYKAIIEKTLDYDETEIIITIGPVAQHLWSTLQINPGVPVIPMKNWNQKNKLADWQAALHNLSNTGYTKDSSPTFIYNGERSQIPRHDLPYGFLRWQGTSGDRAQRAKDSKGKYSPFYYKWFVPEWVYKSKPRPLSQDESHSITLLPQ